VAAVTQTAPEGIAPPRRQRVLFRGGTVWRWVVLLVAAVYFLLPLWAALRFAGVSAFGSMISEPGFTSSLALSVRLAVITTLITIALMLPTTVYVHLRLPKLRRLLEGITILPIVIPPAVLIVGVLAIAPGFLKGTSWLLALAYVVLAMPFTYRALDAGLRARAEDDRGGVELARRGLAHHAVAGAPAQPENRPAVGYRALRGPGPR
jgi:putative spermidine/putrescine transport system permease protein